MCENALRIEGRSVGWMWLMRTVLLGPQAFGRVRECGWGSGSLIVNCWFLPEQLFKHDYPEGFLHFLECPSFQHWWDHLGENAIHFQKRDVPCALGFLKSQVPPGLGRVCTLLPVSQLLTFPMVFCCGGSVVGLCLVFSVS